MATAGPRVFPPRGGRLDARRVRTVAGEAARGRDDRTVTDANAGIGAAAADKGWLERLLSPIADVRRGEAASALLITLTMFLVLAGYYLLKTAREIFILSEGGAEVKSYSSAGQALLLLVLVPAYGAFASRVNRTQLVQWVTLFFAANLLVFLA